MDPLVDQALPARRRGLAPRRLMQTQMRDMAIEAARNNIELPARYWQYLKLWVALGVVAFAALVVVFLLMVAKPA